MSGERDGRDGANESEREDEAAAGPETTEWPVSLTGVTESVVTTLGPNGLWNAAALGLFADEVEVEVEVEGKAEGEDEDKSTTTVDADSRRHNASRSPTIW